MKLVQKLTAIITEWSNLDRPYVSVCALQVK